MTMTVLSPNRDAPPPEPPRSKSQRPVAVDLFAGAGGLALGFEQAGFDVAAAVEYDPVHALTHAFNFPQTEVICGDVAALPAEDLHRSVAAGLRRHGRNAWDGEIDVIFGGPPCQGFSTMGKRLIDDTRNSLVFHFYRLVKELRPRYFVMENVPGIKAGGHAGILQRLIEEFDSVGYLVAPPEILNAAEHGVPQDRRRLFLIGSLEGQRPASYPAPSVIPARKVTGGAGPYESGLPQGPTVADAIGDLPDHDRYTELLKSDEVLLSQTDVGRMEAGASRYAQVLRGVARDPHDLAHPRAHDPQLLTSSARTKHTPLSQSRFTATPAGETEPVSRFLKLNPSGLCNTLRAGTGSERGAFTSPRPIHPEFPRVISVREAARLHSFPDWFRLHSTKWHGFRQIGNAVPPLLGRAVGEQIAAALEVSSKKPRKAIDLGDRELLSLTMSQAARLLNADPGAIPAQRTRRTDRQLEAVD
jgi:DNA (cytosine-5)-methyltransferase 1